MKNTRAKDARESFGRVASNRDAMRLACHAERMIGRMAPVSGVDEGMIVAGVHIGAGFVAAGISRTVGRAFADHAGVGGEETRRAGHLRCPILGRWYEDAAPGERRAAGVIEPLRVA